MPKAILDTIQGLLSVIFEYQSDQGLWLKKREFNLFN
jgi:hypothetical protein